MDLVPIITRRGERVQGFRLKEGIWIDVGRPRDLIRANLVAAERYGEQLSSEPGEGVETSGPFYLGKGSEMMQSQSSSSVILGDCRINDCKLTESLIMDGCDLDGVTVSNSILGRNCKAARGAVIKDAVLGDGTVVPEGAVIEGRV